MNDQETEKHLIMDGLLLRGFASDDRERIAKFMLDNQLEHNQIKEALDMISDLGV